MTRLMSDAYGNDIVRSLMESTNLKANAKDGTAPFAETLCASQTGPEVELPPGPVRENVWYGEYIRLNGCVHALNSGSAP